jgi:hypothetical protein
MLNFVNGIDPDNVLVDERIDVISAMIWVIVAAVSCTVVVLVVLWVKVARQDISTLNIDEELENITTTREVFVEKFE